MLKVRGLTKNECLALDLYGKLLLGKFPRRLKKLLLFGSRARGDAHRDSDVDLLIVLTRNGKKAKQEIAMLTHEPIAKYMVDISPIVVEEKFFKSWSPLLEHIKKDGITIWTSKMAGRNL
jgi:predicted nucleotidyltransferase